jgi:RND family efflux transporter MFP subunit
METNRPPSHHPSPTTRTPAGFKAKSVLLLLCLAVIIAGGVGALSLVRSAPMVKKRPPLKMTPLVRVQEVFPEKQTLVIEAMGTVVPAQELMLKSRVAGEIIDVHPEFFQGGVVRKGEQILQIDDMDYTLLLAQKQSAVADANFELKVELGRQDIARREWALLSDGNSDALADAELALRKPHLEKARSDLMAAKADLKAAQLQLERTRINAPFNAVVLKTHVAKGSQVAAQENLASLVGTDTFWVQVSLPVDRLRWIEIPDARRQKGAAVQVFYQGGAVRKGRVVKLLSDLESEGRMARLLVAVKDPLGLGRKADNRPPMLIGEYVRVAVQGRQIDAAYRIPRTALRDDTTLWLADMDGKLQVRQVQTIWRDSRSVLITQGLRPGERIIISDLAAPIPGMAVTVDNDRVPVAEPASTEDGAVDRPATPKG